MCLICDRIDLIQKGENPNFVCELSTGFVVIGDHQFFEGYTLFLCKECVSELFELEPAFRKRYLYEMTLVAQAVKAAFSCEKLNYECLGNGDSHVHWHLFPRRENDLGEYGHSGRGPVWWLPEEKMWNDQTRVTEEQLCLMKQKLKEELSRLL